VTVIRFSDIAEDELPVQGISAGVGQVTRHWCGTPLCTANPTHRPVRFRSRFYFIIGCCSNHIKLVGG
jgi:hypothetical protein